MKEDVIAHISISTLFLHSDCSELMKKHLFDFRYLLLHERTFSLMNTSILLCQERGYAYGASVIWEPEVAQVPTATMLLVCTRPFERVIPLPVSNA